MSFIDKYAIKLFLRLLLIIILFHLCIIIKIIPYNITWGGRLQNNTEMYVFETISIFINASLSWVLLMKGNYVKYQFPPKIIIAILWIFLIILSFNTIGNIFAKTSLEKFFAILTGVFVLLLWRIIKQKKITNHKQI